MSKRNAPISQVEIEEKILDLLDRLETETEAYEALSADHLGREASYKASWAKEYLMQVEGTQKARESMATHLLLDAALELAIAESKARAQREVLTTLRTSIDALRTLAANVRGQL